MIKEKRLDSWAQFKDTIADIRRDYGYHEVERPDGGTYKRKNTMLFRGQNNANWRIQTTLERKTFLPMHVARYMTYADYCVNEIESCTGRSWNVPSAPQMRDEIDKVQDKFRVHLPAYEYLVYLRHHSFPSPLLDWTESPFIAAFFAFWEKPACSEVAVYSYVESVNGGRSPHEGSPMIRVQGPYVTTHARHFAQKTLCTVATRWNADKKQHYFCSHHDVFDQDDPEQDILIKIIIPSSVRMESLKELLLDYNISPFTLFQTEDALVCTFRENGRGPFRVSKLILQ